MVFFNPLTIRGRHIHNDVAFNWHGLSQSSLDYNDEYYNGCSVNLFTIINSVHKQLSLVKI